MGKLNKKKFANNGPSLGFPVASGGSLAWHLTNSSRSSPAAGSFMLKENKLKPIADMLEDGIDDDASLSTEKKCCTRAKCLHCCRKFMTFVITRIGFMILMIGYVLAGGKIIEALESENERAALKLSDDVLESMMRRIYRQIESNTTRVKDDSFYSFLNSEIRNFNIFYTNATINGTLTGHVEKKWDYFGSVFYCVTLVSTIGYGHITCKTRVGKVFTIIYSSLGVPLMMLFLANIGSSTASLFKFIYLKLRSCRRTLRNCKSSGGTKPPKDGNYFTQDFQLTDHSATTFADDKAEHIYEYLQRQKYIKQVKSQAIKSHSHSSFKHKKKRKATYRDSECSSESSLVNNPPGSDFLTVAVGIRYVDIERIHLERVLSHLSHGFSIPVLKREKNLLNDSINTNKVNTLNANENGIDLIAAIKRIDDLLLDKIDDKKQFESESMKSMDKNRSFSSLEPARFNINSDDEDETTNLNHSSSSEDINQNFLITNILSNKSRKASVKPSSANEELNKQNKKESSSINSQLVSVNETSKPVHPVQTAQVVNKHLTAVMSSPGFDTIHRLDSSSIGGSFGGAGSFKRSKNRSVYSYEHPSTIEKKKLRMAPIYNDKQLDMFYKQYKRQKQDRLDVPMLTTLVIMPLYLVCGMLIFSSFENWKKLDAFYFCFVTLTTIGFGDMIPGTTLSNKNGNNLNNLYISAIYIFLGMILIAMCINLMKDQLKNKIKSFARKIGLSNC